LWYRARTADSRLGTRKTMIVALARKLLIALWRLVTTGETLEGVVLRPAHSGDCDRPFRPKVITGSGDHDHAVRPPGGPA
ncbi:MAG TPA: hypothetical protein VNN81_12705, partial [Bradyrhizobium sp.]|nr:hypothetical protein [Bradyrhizobium sp.]